jgi:hypothetical protein
MAQEQSLIGLDSESTLQARVLFFDGDFLSGGQCYGTGEESRARI